MSRARRRGWLSFLGWAVAGALCFFAVLDLPGLGLVVLPLALVSMWVMATRARVWPEIVGLATGLGAVVVTLAWANRDYQGPCSPGIVLGSGGQTSCGGAPPITLLVAGLLLVVAGGLFYAWRLTGFRFGPIRPPAA